MKKKYSIGIINSSTAINEYQNSRATAWKSQLASITDWSALGVISSEGECWWLEYSGLLNDTQRKEELAKYLF